MGLQLAPGYIGQGGFSTPVELNRNMTMALAGRRTGALRYGDFALTPSASAMQMTIARGGAAIMGNANDSKQGGYFAWSDASETISWPASAGSSRYDSLILRVLDLQYGADASGNGAIWQVVSGTPSGSPTAVTDASFAVGGANYRPGAWWRVADVLVPASVANLSTATITPTRKYARLSGRTLCVIADLPTDAVLGDTAVIIDDGASTLTYDGTNWREIDGAGTWSVLSPYYAAGNQDNTFGYAPAYKLQGKTVRMRGNVMKTTGNWVSPATIMTLPTWIRPAQNTFFQAAATAVAAVNFMVRLDIASTGVVNVTFTTNGATSYTPSWVSLDGIEYDIV